MADVIFTPHPTASIPADLSAYGTAAVAYSVTPSNATREALFKAMAQVIANSLHHTVILHEPIPGFFYTSVV
jgi:hypothetical protein